MANTKINRKIDLPFAVLPPGAATTAHNQRTGAKTGGHKSLGGADHTTQDALILKLLSICALCPPSTAMSSENNIKF